MNLQLIIHLSYHVDMFLRICGMTFLKLIFQMVDHSHWFYHKT